LFGRAVPAEPSRLLQPAFRQRPRLSRRVDDGANGFRPGSNIGRSDQQRAVPCDLRKAGGIGHDGGDPARHRLQDDHPEALPPGGREGGDVGAGVIAGDAARVAKARSSLVRTGATMPHFEAWLALRGLRTLALRMHRHSANAVAVAQFLATATDVRRVYHHSQPEHPQPSFAPRLYPAGTGGMLAFELHGDAPAVDAFLRGLAMISIVHSLGEVATTIAYPAVSSHRPLPPDLRRKLGVTDGTLRLSVGIEAAADITADLARALAGLSQQVRA